MKPLRKQSAWNNISSRWRSFALFCSTELIWLHRLVQPQNCRVWRYYFGYTARKGLIWVLKVRLEVKTLKYATKTIWEIREGKKCMRLEKLGFNITSNPFLVALSILDMICDLYLIFVHYFLGLHLAWSTVIDFSSPEEKPVMRTMFDRSPTFPTRNPRDIFWWHYTVTSPFIVCKQHSQVSRLQDKPFDLSSDKKSIINSS